MSVDRTLFVSPTWEAEDIKELLSTLPEVKDLKIHNSHTPSYVIITFTYDGNEKEESRQLNFHYNSKRAGFIGQLITLGAWGSSETILKAIAERIGGFYEHTDCDGVITAFDYPAQSSLEFMVRHSVIRGKCDGKNFEEFAKDYKAVTASWKYNSTIKL